MLTSAGTVRFGRAASSQLVPIIRRSTYLRLWKALHNRKNWLVFASERGGAVASRLYSLMLSCREADVDPEAYLVDVLGRVSSTSAADIAQLTPWGWAVARNDERGE